MSAMSSRRGKSKKAAENLIKSEDPKDLERRIFVGNLPSDKMSRNDFETLFSKYGAITAVSMFRGYGFVQYERKEDADSASKGENGQLYKGYRLDINKAVDRRNMNKGPSRSSPSRRDVYGFGQGQEQRRERERSPLRSSPRRGSREPRDRDSRAVRDGRDGREPRDRDLRDLRDGREREFREPRDARDPRDTRELRDTRDARDIRDTRDVRDLRDLRDAARETRESRELRELRETREPRDARDLRARDARDVRDPLERYREARDPRDPLYRVDDIADKFRLDDLSRKRDDLYDRLRDSLDRFPEDRLKREERRREELYRQYFDEIQRKVDAERPVDCSVVVVNKQSKEYAESVGRKVRDLGMMVDLIFLNTEVSLTQALEDVSRGGSPFAIVITQQHQTHHSCTVNILCGTPQEHRNMPIADAMLLVARSHERYKTESRDKEREDIARQAAKLSAEAILRERGALDEGVRGGPPPGIMTIIGLLADNRYVTAEEIDKVILYLQQRKERLMAMAGDSLPSQLSRQTAPATSLAAQSSLAGSQSLQLNQQLSSATAAPQTTSSSQQELQAKILSLFNSGVSTSSNQVNTASSAVSNQNYGNLSNTQQRPAGSMDAGLLGPAPQRPQPTASHMSNVMAAGLAMRSAAPRPGPTPQMQNLYGQLQNRVQVPGSVPGQRPGASSGINVDNPSVQKALDTLIQSGPALSHLMGQAVGQALRGGQTQQPSMGSYPRPF
ncbi:nuclear receptor coactivator 5 isoform X2 [Rana temporaria]|uniref:nuclear receptor coactivator 5 isoform X2 n=1 Tax=Rana temporaria TaxID=8407 RepID=UPI001AAD73E4|nr:nuclear receptor coactivator 5 isoform X2 [Rana temporaria]